MSDRAKLFVAGSLVVAGACNEPIRDTIPPAQPESVAATPEVAARLWREPVTLEKFARRVLYTWTTADQIAALRTDRTLLVREESPERGATLYEQTIHALAIRDAGIAKLLDSTGFAKSRFAWPAPWATAMGFPGEQYGDQLIRVTLKPEAIILAVSAETGSFVAHDLDDRDVSLVDVVAHPERIGAVYSIVENSFREYVLCNESMIAGWSIGTTQIAAEVASEAESLESLVHYLATTPSVPPATAEAYASSVALINESYTLEPNTIAAIVARLRGLPKATAFEGVSTVRWAGIGDARKPPRVVPPPDPRRDNSYSSYYRPQQRGTH